MRIREAYIIDIVKAEQAADDIPSVGSGARRVHIPEVWRNFMYDNLSREEQRVCDMATD